MKKIILFAVTMLAVTTLESPAQTKFIAHRSHSGIDRLFDPQGVGNFGEFSHYREWIVEDTLKKGDTSGDASNSSNINPKSKPEESIPESKSITQPAVHHQSTTSQPQNATPQENVQQPEAPENELPATDSADKPEEPGFADNNSSPSTLPPADQVSSIVASDTKSKEDQSGWLPFLALGLGIPALMIVVRGLRRRENDLG